MKRRLIFTLSLLFICLCFFLRCANEYGFQPFDEAGKNSSFSTQVDFAPLLKNPYDALGQYHNNALDTIFNELKNEQIQTKATGESVQISITNAVRKYMIENDVFTYVQADKVTSESIGIIKEEAFFTKLTTWTPQIKTKGSAALGLSSSQIPYYNQIKSLLYLKSIRSPQDLITKINKVEVKIAEDNNLSELEKSQLLISSAVAKYSSIYWINHLMQNTDINKNIRTRGSNEESGGFWDWWTNVASPNISSIIESDFTGAAAGAAMGAVSGGTIGSVVPGPGTVTVGITGGVVGGASGAIGGSVYQGIKIIFE